MCVTGHPIQTRLRIGELDPKGGASTIRRGKRCWAGRKFNVFIRSLGKWPHQVALFVPSDLDRFPINSLPSCVILPHFNFTISTKWSIVFNSKTFGTHHMLYVLMEIIQGAFLKYITTCVVSCLFKTLHKHH